MSIMQIIFLVLLGIYSAWFFISEIPPMVSVMKMNETNFKLLTWKYLLEGKVLHNEMGEMKSIVLRNWLTRLFIRIMVVTVLVYFILRFV